MFNPEMMRMAQEMMSKMSPEQLATMQQQAASMSPDMMRAAMQAAQGVKPEDLRRAGEQVASMPPEALAAQASAAASQLPARERMLLTASNTLKRDGNELFGRGSHAQAAEKYERAVANLESVGGAEAAALRLGCRNNLAACRLALKDWAGARAACDAVLAEDAANRKALYRRGQALLSLGLPAQAEADLAAALRLSDAGDRAAIQEKLDTARAAVKERPDEAPASEPAVSEPAASEPAAARPATEEQDGAIEDVEVIEEVEVIRPAPSAPRAAPAARFDPHDPRSAEAAAEMLERNPDQVKAAMDALHGMSDAQLAAQMAAAGAPPGMTPEMARAAAGMVQNLSPDQLRSFAQVRHPTAGIPAPAAAPATASAPSSAAPSSVAPPPTPSPAVMQDPKAMAAMLRGMDPQMLQMMAEASGAGAGLPAGTQLDASTLQAAASMMESMSPDDMARMMEMMGGAGPGGAGAAGPAGAAAAGPGVLGAGDLAGKLGDPAMLKTMRNMLKSMPPEALEEMGKQSGLKITPQMVDKLGNLSDKAVDRIAMLLRVVMSIVKFVRRCWAFVRGQQGLALGVVLLLVAIVLRWLGRL